MPRDHWSSLSGSWTTLSLQRVRPPAPACGIRYLGSPLPARPAICPDLPANTNRNKPRAPGAAFMSNLVLQLSSAGWPPARKGAPSSQDSQSKTDSLPSRTRVFQGAKSPCQTPHGTLTFSRSRRAAAKAALPNCCHRQSHRQVTSFQRVPTSSITWRPDLSMRRTAASFSRNSTCMPDSSTGPGRPSSGDWNSI